MTDDIVTRLRRMDANIPSVDPDKYVSPTEAADEIERLRKELRLTQRAYDMAVFGESDIDENGVLRD